MTINTDRPNDDVIEIADLHAPVLNDMQKAALQFAADNPVTLTADSVLDAARDQAQLSDFGSDDFLERLRIWALSADEDRELSAVGRMAVFNEMVRFARTRLQVEDCVQCHPEILDVDIDRPVMVAGLPRSGTTHLLEVIASDPQFRSLPYWEAVLPVAARYIEDGVDKRVELANTMWAQQMVLLPHISAIHDLSNDHISEDVELQCIDFGSYYLEWLCNPPRWRDYYLSHDHTSVYQYMRKVLQVLTWHQGPNRWVSKCPQHVEQLPALRNAFPDSCIVVTHRDPVASIQSAITGLAYAARLNRTKVDCDAILDTWVTRYETLLRRFVDDRAGVADDRYHDVYFDQLMARPEEIVEEIYAKAGLDITDETRAAVEQTLHSKTRGRHGRVDYDLRRDFGVEPAAIRERFAFYFDAFPVKVEVQ